MIPSKKIKIFAWTVFQPHASVLLLSYNFYAVPSGIAQEGKFLCEMGNPSHQKVCGLF
jgi:hypothetical protein